MSLSNRLLTELKGRITSYELIPSKGGCFELAVDGDLIYSKLDTGEFPNDADMLEAVKAHGDTRN